jgi:hypothetical protein
MMESFEDKLRNLDIDYVAMIETGVLLLIVLYVVSLIVKVLMSGIDGDKKPTIGIFHVLRLIVVVHFGAAYYYTPTSDGSFFGDLIQNFVAWGNHAHLFLVVLSGFVLTYQNVEAVGEFKTREFFVKRLGRWPLLLAAVVLNGYSYPEASFGTWPRIKRAGITLGMIQGWWHERFFMKNEPLWSVSIYAFLVFLFPTLLRLVDGFGKSERKSRFQMIFFLWLVSCGLNFLMESSDAQYLMHGPAAPYMYIPAFLMGMMTGELFVTKPAYDLKAAEIIASRFGGTIGLGLIFICWCFVPTLKFVEDPELTEKAIHMWHFNGTLAPLYCFTLYWLGNEKDLLAKFFSFKIIWVFGATAPSAYLFFVPAHDFATRSEGNVPYATDVIFIGTIIIMALVSYFLLEVPFCKWALAEYRGGKEV